MQAVKQATGMPRCVFVVPLDDTPALEISEIQSRIGSPDFVFVMNPLSKDFSRIRLREKGDTEVNDVNPVAKLWRQYPSAKMLVAGPIGSLNGLQPELCQRETTKLAAQLI